jgi:hypothetical protein
MTKLSSSGFGSGSGETSGRVPPRGVPPARLRRGATIISPVTAIAKITRLTSANTPLSKICMLII